MYLHNVNPSIGERVPCADGWLGRLIADRRAERLSRLRGYLERRAERERILRETMTHAARVAKNRRQHRSASDTCPGLCYDCHSRIAVIRGQITRCYRCLRAEMMESYVTA